MYDLHYSNDTSNTTLTSSTSLADKAWRNGTMSSNSVSCTSLNQLDIGTA